MKLKKGDKKLEWKVTWHPLRGETKCDFMTNTYSPPEEGNFCDEHWEAPKLAIVQDCTNGVYEQILPHDEH